MLCHLVFFSLEAWMNVGTTLSFNRSMNQCLKHLPFSLFLVQSTWCFPQTPYQTCFFQRSRGTSNKQCVTSVSLCFPKWCFEFGYQCFVLSILYKKMQLWCRWNCISRELIRAKYSTYDVKDPRFLLLGGGHFVHFHFRQIEDFLRVRIRRCGSRVTWR